MSYKAGDAYSCTFTTQRIDTGYATNADVLPTALVYKNAMVDNSFSLTVTNISTGRYSVTGTVPLDYATRTSVQVVVQGVVNGVTSSQVIDNFLIVDDTATSSSSGGSSVTLSRAFSIV